MQKRNIRTYSKSNTHNVCINPKGRKKLASKFYIDFSIFRDTKLTIFESLIKYLKENKEFTYHKIALILGRDERNIWTVYNRTRSKIWKII